MKSVERKFFFKHHDESEINHTFLISFIFIFSSVRSLCTMYLILIHLIRGHTLHMLIIIYSENYFALLSIKSRSMMANKTESIEEEENEKKVAATTTTKIHVTK